MPITPVATISGRLIEVHVGLGLPSFDIVGLASNRVREARDRIRVAIVGAGYHWPNRRIMICMPAQQSPYSMGWDLPIALGVLIASEQIPWRDKVAAYGGLPLDGEIRPDGWIDVGRDEPIHVVTLNQAALLFKEH